MKLFFILLCLIFSHEAYTQQYGEKIYFDQNYDTVLQGGHKFYRIESPDSNEILVKDYYRDGTLRREGKRSPQHDTTFWVGDLVVYHTDGSIWQKMMYIDNKASGPCHIYYPSGQLKRTSLYKEDLLTGPDTLYYESGHIESARNFRDGKKTGNQFYYYDTTGVLRRREVYQVGEMTEGYCYDREGNSIPFFERFTKAKYKGKNLDRFMDINLEYPMEAALKGLQARVVLKVVIEVDGSLTPYKINKSDPNILINEAIRVIMMTSGKWEPALLEDEPVPSSIYIPFKFKFIEQSNTPYPPLQIKRRR